MSWKILDQCKIGKVQYINGIYKAPLDESPNGLLTSITGNNLTNINPVIGMITNVSQSSSSGAGSGVEFTLRARGGVFGNDPNPGCQITVTSQGNGLYEVGDTITITTEDLNTNYPGWGGSVLGGPLVITLQSDDFLIPSASNSEMLDIAGYSIEVSFVASGTVTATVQLQGSLDGVNFFEISRIEPVTTAVPINKLISEIPVKFIVLRNGSGANILSISFSGEA